MSELIIPKKSTRVDLDFFKRHAETVAKDLLGRVFVREVGRKTLYLRLEEVAAFEGDIEKMRKRYKGVLEYPGTLAISTQFGQDLIHISTLGLGEPSCVNLIAGTLFDKQGYEEYVNGPGNLSLALEIDKDYNGVLLNFNKFWIGGLAVEKNRILKRDKSGLPENCKGYFYFR